MTHDRWVTAALTGESLVADLLLRMKHSSDSDSDSLSSPSQPQRTEAVIINCIPPRWGNRKNRSKSTTPVIAGKKQRGSPDTHLSWSGGGSTSDESSRSSDLSSGFRSVKSCFELNDEEGLLIKERMHINKELTSMRVNLNQQMSTNQNLKKIKINYGQNPRNTTSWCRVEVEIKSQERGFVLPDLNMTPNDEDLIMMMMLSSENE